MYTVIHSLISVIIISFIIICSITHIRFVCFLSNTSLPVSDVPYMQNTNAVKIQVTQLSQRNRAIGCGLRHNVRCSF